MAITRLTDIITVFESKWTYGDVKFGYESEINQDHDAKYPLMLIEPPASVIPEIYNGREEYEFEINFYNLYSQAAQSVVTLQKRWDNLQDLANEWLDMVLKNYQDNTVEVYLNDESIEIERVKEVANDRLVQIKLTFTMSAFTKCFRPVSNYPSDYSDLVVWLKADSGVTFDIPTKRVSAWADQSGNSNSAAQATTAHQPLRYGYDGANDKAYINFDGTNDVLTSTSNNPISANSFTMFMVAKQHTSHAGKNPVFGYSSSDANVAMGFNDNKVYGYINDGGSNEASFNGGVASNYNVFRMQFIGGTGTLRTQLNGGAISSDSLTWTDTTVFNEASYTISKYRTSDFGKVNIAEVIVYNRSLQEAEISKINDYLNKKFKIY